jgi:hypothetical protein
LKSQENTGQKTEKPDSTKQKKSLQHDFSFANWGEATERWLKGVKKRYMSLFPDVSNQARILAGVKVKPKDTGTASSGSESDSSGRDLDSNYEDLGDNHGNNEDDHANPQATESDNKAGHREADDEDHAGAQADDEDDGPEAEDEDGGGAGGAIDDDDQMLEDHGGKARELEMESNGPSYLSDISTVTPTATQAGSEVANSDSDA